VSGVERRVSRVDETLRGRGLRIDQKGPEPQGFKGQGSVKLEGWRIEGRSKGS